MHYEGTLPSRNTEGCVITRVRKSVYVHVCEETKIKWERNETLCSGKNSQRGRRASYGMSIVSIYQASTKPTILQVSLFPVVDPNYIISCCVALKQIVCILFTIMMAHVADGIEAHANNSFNRKTWWLLIYYWNVMRVVMEMIKHVLSSVPAK